MFDLRKMTCGTTGLLFSGMILIATLAPVSVASAAEAQGQRLAACADAAPVRA